MLLIWLIVFFLVLLMLGVMIIELFLVGVVCKEDWFIIIGFFYYKIYLLCIFVLIYVIFFLIMIFIYIKIGVKFCKVIKEGVDRFGFI